MQTKKTTEKADAPAEVRAQHTPGPWTTDGSRIFHQRNAGGRKLWVAETLADANSNQRAANARLIASAPDLLAACKALFRECSMVHKYWGDGWNQEQSDAAIAAALAAIARVEGSAQ